MLVEHLYLQPYHWNLGTRLNRQIYNPAQAPRYHFGLNCLIHPKQNWLPSSSNSNLSCHHSCNPTHSTIQQWKIIHETLEQSLYENILQLNVMFTVVKHIKGFLKAEVLNLSKLYYIDFIESLGLGLIWCLLSTLWVFVLKFFTRFESVNIQVVLSLACVFLFAFEQNLNKRNWALLQSRLTHQINCLLNINKTNLRLQDSTISKFG